MSEKVHLARRQMQQSQHISPAGRVGLLEDFMGRFNWIWRALWTLSVLVCAAGAVTPALAFDANTPGADDGTLGQRFGTDCTISPYVVPSMGIAHISIYKGGSHTPGWHSPENNFWWFSDKLAIHETITKTDIADCLLTTTENITSLEQNGADGTYETDNYIGFKFTLAEAAGGLAAGAHEYKVGSGEFPVAGPTPEQTREQIAGYMQNRASQIIVAQPDLIGLLSGGSTGSFNADVTQSNGNFDFATSGDQPVWATLQGSWSEFGTTESSYFFGAVGAHTQVSPDALVGIMFEFDKLTQTDGVSSTEGDGYLVGPYFVAKLPSQPLFIEGRLLTGQTENQVSVVGVGGTATETFDTQRTFASIKVAGQLDYGELVLTPSLTATHLRDEQDAFTNTQGNTVAAQGIEVNSVAAGLNFAQAVSLSNGELMLTGGISGIWSSNEGTEFASSAAPTTDGQRARITLGASHTLPNGVVLSAGTFYDGIGLNDYESYGLDLGIQMQF
jgi:hypothetical protein